MDQVTPSPTEDRSWITFCHLAALIALLGIPFGNIIGPLVVWLAKRHESAAVDAHGKEALNFQISMSIYTLVAALSCFFCIGFVLLPAIVIANFVLIIIASIKASNGDLFRYPLSIRLVA